MAVEEEHGVITRDVGIEVVEEEVDLAEAEVVAGELNEAYEKHQMFKSNTHRQAGIRVSPCPCFNVHGSLWASL